MKTLILILSIFYLQDNSVPFQKLYEKDGFEVKFLFFSEGNGVKDNGISLMLINKREYSVGYSFTLIFRAGNVDKIVQVKGEIEPGKKKTGSTDGLYWIPFNDKRTITKVGITKIRLTEITK